MDIIDKIDSLRKEISEHNYKYYVLDSPTISDYEFDSLMNKLTFLENKYPQFYDKNSPTQRVGGEILKSFSSIPHKYKMLSLSNTYTESELYDFDKRLRKITDQSFSYVCELKYDGVSISLHYKNGELIQALTRGDGSFGDDVTLNVKTIKSIPLKLQGDYPSEFEIRGEIFIPNSDFNEMNEMRKSKGLEPYSNPRNTASGSLKILDTAEVSKRPLDCFFFYILGDLLPSNSHYKNLQLARTWGFKIPFEIEKFRDISQVCLFVKKWELKRRDLPFDIDGIVIKVDETLIQDEMGNTSKFPRWAISFKFKTEQVLTRINSIDYQVGRTGAITPVANLEPVKLLGTIVKRASLHNHDQIKKLDVRVGDYVYVEKGGEIIPKVVKVELNKRDLFSDIFRFINKCPACKSFLSRKDGDAKHYCLNSNECPPQISSQFEHFVSKKAMDIDSIGSETIDLLIEKKIITSIPDLYELSINDLIPLKKSGNRWAENIINGINKSKEKTFDKVLFALGIRYIGETTAKKLANHFLNIDELINSKYEDVLLVDEIGIKIANSLEDYFDNKRNINLIDRLKNHGIKFIQNTHDNIISNRLKDKKIVVSGVFNNFSRKQIKDLIEKHGGKNVNSISKKTNFVIGGSNIGPMKVNKANILDIPIISEIEFINMIK